jgi:hypothetical protein
MTKRPEDPLDEVERAMALEEELEHRLSTDSPSHFSWVVFAVLATVAVLGIMLWMLSK